MQKALVETSGEFQLVDYTYDGQTIYSHRPTVVALTNFFQTRISLGQVKVISIVKEEATDEEFLNYWDESENAELAVDAFIASFNDTKPTQKTVKASPARKAKKASVE